MSAKWRRSKKRSKWLDIFRTFNGAEAKNTRQLFQIENSKVKRQTRPYTHRATKIHKGRTWREPKTLIDVLEEKDDIIVVAEFAGFMLENLRTNIKNRRLILSAEALDRKYYKSLNLPKRVIPNAIRTTYKNGVLEIRLKKSMEEKTLDNAAG